MVGVIVRVALERTDEDEVEEEVEDEVGADDEAHDTTLGTVTPLVEQSWSAKVIVATEHSQTLALRYRFRVVLTVLVLR